MTYLTNDPAADYDRHMADAASRCYVCDDRKDVRCVGCDHSLCEKHATQKRPKTGWKIEYWCDECLGDRPTPAPRSEP